MVSKGHVSSRNEEIPVVFLDSANFKELVEGITPVRVGPIRGNTNSIFS